MSQHDITEIHEPQGERVSNAPLLALLHADRAREESDAGLDGLQARSQKAFDTLRELDTHLKDHPQFRHFTGDLTKLHREHQALGDMLRDLATLEEIATDSVGKTILTDEFRHIQTRIGEIKETIEKELSKGEVGEPPVPDYVRDNRPPLDSETFLGNKELASGLGLILERTDLRVKGATVYHDQHGNYYHRDTLHTGPGAEIECYDQNGNHIGTRYPDGSEKDGPVKGRRLPGI